MTTEDIIRLPTAAPGTRGFTLEKRQAFARMAIGDDSLDASARIAALAIALFADDNGQLEAQRVDDALRAVVMGP